ncbi:glutathione S-transferase family protein [Defluviimonas sp. WL0050]|uniref:Glutathione S-transferase family protein n=1 Tax=Albidovulum litorale TaxID=2984134 RepID=A0ABT2ZQG4_9RHOB|nr:glutathione S-transferase family protein [Defluviimonas sp. WL0050]MCV2873401.1 glutathione S-transferase family protein [Defluviimonas sp. WL0050]
METAPYILHYAPDNASLIVRLVLEELGQPFRTELVDRKLRVQDSGEYRRIHPNGLIPALETPDGPIFETGAILLWLSERHGALAPLPGAPERAAFLKWLFFTSNTLHADIRLHFYPDRHAGAPDCVPAFSAATRDRIIRHLGLMEVMATERPLWFRPETPSILTYYVSCLLRWLALYPEGGTGWFDPASWPSLNAIAAAMELRPAATKAALAEGLGQTIFTKPSYACPPEGSAT